MPRRITASGITLDVDPPLMEQPVTTSPREENTSLKFLQAQKGPRGCGQGIRRPFRIGSVPPLSPENRLEIMTRPEVGPFFQGHGAQGNPGPSVKGKGG